MVRRIRGCNIKLVAEVDGPNAFAATVPAARSSMITLELRRALQLDVLARMYVRESCDGRPARWVYCECVPISSYKRVKGRSHSVEEQPADTHKTPMQPVSHHCSPIATHTANNAPY